MKRKFKQTFAAIITVVMILSVIPCTSLRTIGNAMGIYQLYSEGYKDGYGYSHDEDGNLWISDVKDLSLS